MTREYWSRCAYDPDKPDQVAKVAAITRASVCGAMFAELRPGRKYLVEVESSDFAVDRIGEAPSDGITRVQAVHVTIEDVTPGCGQEEAT